ncbi:hypothetical protein SLEP1_g29078 [Rubroshorea leprosula]|uniref:Uncharacterized protein n=1 Tax=Rubroshorea leprosula TaxID=152421 RepID=A0AAV5K4C9_9ROSI|nr:hypothetical protein SLEP1_g29078 [Rubroshorea leprosula]
MSDHVDHDSRPSHVNNNLRCFQEGEFSSSSCFCFST